MKIKVVGCVWLAQGGVSANAGVSVNTRGRGLESVTSQFTDPFDLLTSYQGVMYKSTLS